MEEDNPGKGIFDPGEGTSSGVNSRSRTSLWRDQQKILNAANHDPDAISKAHQTILPTADAAYVAKRISSDPHLGEPLRKYIKKLDHDLQDMNDEFGRYEDDEIVSPIKALAYLLGQLRIPCSVPILSKLLFSFFVLQHHVQLESF